MNQKSLQQYLKLREELASDLVHVDGEIEEFKLQIAQLEEYREELQKALDGETTRKNFVVLTMEESLMEHLRTNPGSDRAQIQEALRLDEPGSKNLVGKMRKRGVIVNHGTRRHAQYYITGLGAGVAE